MSCLGRLVGETSTKRAHGDPIACFGNTIESSQPLCMPSAIVDFLVAYSKIRSNVVALLVILLGLVTIGIGLYISLLFLPQLIDTMFNEEKALPPHTAAETSVMEPPIKHASKNERAPYHGQC